MLPRRKPKLFYSGLIYKMDFLVWDLILMDLEVLRTGTR